MNFKIYIFDKKGKFISSFGKRGEGPGEIKRMRGMFFIDDSVVISDDGKIHFFDKMGKYIKSSIFPVRLRPRAFISGNTFISAPLVPRVGSKEPAEIAVFDLNTKEQKIIKEYDPYKKAVSAKEDGGGQIAIAIVIRGLTPMMIIHYHKGKVYYGMNNVYNINISDLKSKEKDSSFSVEGKEAKKVSLKFKKDLFSRMGDVPPDMLKNLMEGLPDRASFFHEIKIGNNGLIYVFISDLDNRTSQEIDIFSPDGKYLYSSEIKIKDGESIERYYFNNNTFITI